MKKLIISLIVICASVLSLSAQDFKDEVDPIIAKASDDLYSMINQNNINETIGENDKNHYFLNVSFEKSTHPTPSNGVYIKQPTSIDQAQYPILPYIKGDISDVDNRLVSFNSQLNLNYKVYFILFDDIPVETFKEYPHVDAIGQLLKTSDFKNSTLSENVTKSIENAKDFFHKAFDAEMKKITIANAGSSKPIFFLTLYRFKAVVNNTKIARYYYYNTHFTAEFPQVEEFNRIFENAKTKLLISKVDEYTAETPSDKGKARVNAYIDVVYRTNENLAATNLFLQAIDFKIQQAIHCEQTLQVGRPLTDCYGLNLLLNDVPEVALVKLNLTQRVKLLKILANGRDIANEYESQVVSLIRTTPDNDIDSLLIKLKENNELDWQLGTSLIYSVYNAVEDRDAGFLDLTGDNTLTAFMIELKNLLIKSPTFQARLRDGIVRDVPMEQKRFIWDYDYLAFVRDITKVPPLNTEQYDVTFSKAAVLTVKKKICSELTTVRTCESYGPEGMGGTHCTTSLRPVWSNYPDFTIADPFLIIDFTNKSDVLIAVPPDNYKAENDPLGNFAMRFVPAIFLNYGATKQINNAVNNNIRLGLNAAAIFIPYTRLLGLVSAGTWFQKIVAASQLVGTGVGMTDIVISYTPLENNHKLRRVIGYIGGAAGILSLGGFSKKFGQLNALTAPEDLKTSAGRFVAAIETDQEAFMELQRLLQEGTAIEKQMALEILQFFEDLKLKGALIWGSTDWYMPFKVNSTISTGRTAQRIDELTNLFSRVDKAAYNQQFGHFEFFDNLAQKPYPAGAAPLAHTNEAGQLVINNTTSITEEMHDITYLADAEYVIGNSQKASPLMIAKNTRNVTCFVEGMCFVGGTKVVTTHGEKAIQDITEQDSVLTYNEANKTTGFQKVYATTKRTAKKLIKLFIGKEEIVTTPEHPFYLTEKIWRKASELKTGLKLFTLSGAVAVVTNVQALDSSAVVYNFEVPVTHNYFVGQQGILVHNTCNAFIAKFSGRLGRILTEAEQLIWSGIVDKLKVGTGITSVEALTRLEGLCNSATSAQLSSLWTFIKAAPANADKFANDLRLNIGLLDDFARDGSLLERYVASESNINNTFKEFVTKAQDKLSFPESFGKYIDNAIVKIGDPEQLLKQQFGKLGTASTSDRLSKNMVAIGILKNIGDHAHHIVFKGVYAAGSQMNQLAQECRNIIANAGVYLDEAANGVFLTTIEHSNIHTISYLTALRTRLRAAPLDRIRSELQLIAQEIKSGTFPF